MITKVKVKVKVVLLRREYRNKVYNYVVMYANEVETKENKNYLR